MVLINQLTLVHYFTQWYTQNEKFSQTAICASHTSNTYQLHEKKDTCNVASQSVYVYVKEQIRIVGAHVEE